MSDTPVMPCDKAHTLEALIRIAMEGSDTDARDRAAVELAKSGVFVGLQADDIDNNATLTRS
jgi:hypothetical protein